jgi:hypothetical protein
MTPISTLRNGRIGKTTGAGLALCAVSVCAAAVITISPRVGSLLAGLIGVFLLIEYVLPPVWATTLPLIVVFVIPGDELLRLSDRWVGLFVVTASTFLAAATLIRGRFRIRRRIELALPALAAMYIAFYAIHVSRGALRGATFWIAAVGIWVWLNGRIAADAVAARQGIQNAIISIGAIGGASGLAERLGIIDPTQWVTAYEPSVNMFTEEIGRRASGLSGHPLCLGALCMLGCGLAIIRLVLAGRKRLRAPWLAIALVASGGGLILSGARGSWLALLCGLALAFAATIQFRRISGFAVLRGSLVAGAIAGLLMLTGLGLIVRERLVGAASAPKSIGQRIVAFQTIIDSLPDLPLLGVGPGGVDEFIVRGGSVIPNIENEYLIALVLGGPLAMLGLVAFCGSMVRIAFREAIGTGDLGALTLWVGMSVNIATFNFFSWPIGPPLLATIACLVILPRQAAVAESGASRA